MKTVPDIGIQDKMKLFTGTDPPDPREATIVAKKKTALSSMSSMKTPEEDKKNSLRVSTVRPNSLKHKREKLLRGEVLAKKSKMIDKISEKSRLRTPQKTRIWVGGARIAQKTSHLKK
jgi:hypothetical protein